MKTSASVLLVAALPAALILSSANAFVPRPVPTINTVSSRAGTTARSTFSQVVVTAKSKASASSSNANDDKDKDKDNNVDKNKLAALDGVINQIEQSYGRGSILKLGDAHGMVVDCVSTGALTLDAALGGGGYPKGRIVEIYGPEACGKTTLALHAIASAQLNGGMAAFIDAEHALDPAYAEHLGVNTNDLFVCQPDSGEMALDVVDKLVRSAAMDVIVIDSVAALVPRAELEGDMSDSQIGLQARLMSKAMRKITGSLAASQTVVVFLNQLRSKVGVIYGSPEVTSGGNALKFYASVRLDIRRKEILPDNAGIRVKVRVVKNKVAAPFQVVQLDILFGQGIDGVGCLVDAAEEWGVVVRKGSWYAYEGENIAQGRAKVVEALKEDPVFLEDMQTKVKQAMGVDASGANKNEEDSSSEEEEDTRETEDVAISNDATFE
ncbi:Protein RecA [Seminavis robusta]|uniref:Protein RecA n=1 Tax=Seminavis robusta TaxID=568900 RepID=A0A9N8DGS8_9STRA|nr:Protein RecA [Seminavis robusta]|eukprot:Sro60_g034520.1 Protein RecA (438) ;mRNA; r:16118-17539